MIDLIDVKFYLCSYAEDGVSLKLAVRIKHVEPNIISRSAGRSNLQIKTSFRKNKASAIWNRIALAELKESSTMSQNGVAAIHMGDFED